MFQNAKQPHNQGPTINFNSVDNKVSTYQATEWKRCHKDAKFQNYFIFDASEDEKGAWLHIMQPIITPNYVTLDSVANI